jgi:hypothetical protein
MIESVISCHVAGLTTISAVAWDRKSSLWSREDIAILVAQRLEQKDRARSSSFLPALALMSFGS